MRVIVSLFLGAVMAALVSAAWAGPIRGAVGVTANGGNFPPDPIIDQSGLSAAYVSGTTDFDTYVASTTASFGGIGGTLGDTAPPPGGVWVFDLGAVYSINATAIWNQNGSASLDDFSLDASLTSDFAISTALGSFGMSIFGGDNPIAADVFSFASVDARYIRLNVTSNAGFIEATRINEIAFRQADAAVPEPGGFALIGLALAALGLARRKPR